MDKCQKLLLCFFLFTYTYSQSVPKGIIHFISTGGSNAFLLESNGKFGLVDSANPYLYSEHEVEKVVIDPKKDDDQGMKDPSISVQRVIDYLNLLGVDKLEFIIATHSHSDHIGGVPAIAYYFVDNSTYYYYKTYKKTHEDVDTRWANEPYYKAALDSMRIKGAQLVEVTGKDISFNLGDFKINLLSTEEKDCYDIGENCYCISQLITIGNNRIFLQADLHNREDKKIAGKVGRIDVYQLGHHGVSGSASYEFISVIRPKVAIIPNGNVPTYSYGKISYMESRCNTKVYLTLGAGNKWAIKANFYESGYDLENTGKNVDTSEFNGWADWNEKWTYLDKGILLTGWQDLKWSKGTDRFYFDSEGIMLIGWQELEWEKGKDIFYFDPESGYMLRNTCRVIDGKEYCFDENGVLIK
ncbi:MAG: MBL fold metallo-hydrolase [archaeon]|nr:MBL fold metallo-hydrolase [archaeon]